MKTSILLLGLSIFISYAQAESDAKAPESPAAPEGDLEETVPTQHQNLTPLPLKRLEFKKLILHCMSSVEEPISNIVKFDSLNTGTIFRKTNRLIA